MNDPLTKTIAKIDVYRRAVMVESNRNSGDWIADTLVQLAAMNSYLGDKVVEYENDVTSLETSYKVTRERQKLDYINKVKMSATAAESQAYIDTETELEAFNKAKYQFNILRVKRSDTNHLIDALRSKLSFLKSERSQV